MLRDLSLVWFFVICHLIVIGELHSVTLGSLVNEKSLLCMTYIYTSLSLMHDLSLVGSSSDRGYF